MIVSNQPDKINDAATSPRPPASPLLVALTQHPARIDTALLDASPSIEHAKALRRELHVCSRGELDPDAASLRMVFAYLGMAGCHGLLDAQRAWHATHGKGAKH